MMDSPQINYDFLNVIYKLINLKPMSRKRMQTGRFGVEGTRGSVLDSFSRITIIIQIVQTWGWKFYPGISKLHTKSFLRT